MQDQRSKTPIFIEDAIGNQESMGNHRCVVINEKFCVADELEKFSSRIDFGLRKASCVINFG